VDTPLKLNVVYMFHTCNPGFDSLLLLEAVPRKAGSQPIRVAIFIEARFSKPGGTRVDRLKKVNSKKDLWLSQLDKLQQTCGVAKQHALLVCFANRDVSLLRKAPKSDAGRNRQAESKLPQDTKAAADLTKVKTPRAILEEESVLVLNRHMASIVLTPSLADRAFFTLQDASDNNKSNEQ
jgi:hypothetical protein